MRTFVFITEIPEYLLQPVHASSSSGGADALAPQRSNRDPRYERLRRLLADHTSGLMLVMHLETSGYALALYASEEEALDACKAVIKPEQPGQQYPPLHLRVVEKERPPPPEAVYTPTITVEGEQVLKRDLADTRGLELAYRGRTLPKWCPKTLEGQDCPFGTSCHRVHRASCQRTVRKRPRVEEEDYLSKLSETDVEEVDSITQCYKVFQERLVPPELRVTPTVYVPLSLAEANACVGAAYGSYDSVPSASSSSSHVTPLQGLASPLVSSVVKRAEAACATLGLQGPLFARLSCPGGAPWDWSLYDEKGPQSGGGTGGGLAELRQRCPLPDNGAPTPLERDIFCQKLFYTLNQLNAFATVSDAVHALHCSPRVKEALRAHVDRSEQLQQHRRAAARQHSPTADGDDGSDTGVPAAAAPGGAAGVQSTSILTGVHDVRGARGSSVGHTVTSHKGAQEDGALPLFLCIQPWLYLPTVDCEVSAFVERGGRRLRGAVQRYGQVRLMTSANLLRTVTTTAAAAAAVTNRSSDGQSSLSDASLLQLQHDVDAALSRFAVLGAGNDVEAESCLESETLQWGKLLARAVDQFRRGVSRQSEAGKLPAGAAWCVQFAMRIQDPIRQALHGGPVVPPSVVLLSVKPYQRALEECPMYVHLSGGSGGGGEVVWNVQKHPYVALFSRDVMERLRVQPKT